jgi:hypothetical protein
MESVASRFSVPPVRSRGAKIELKGVVTDPELKVYTGTAVVPAKLIDESPVSSEPLPYPAVIPTPVNPPAYSAVHTPDETPRVVPEFQYPASNYVRVPEYKAVNAPGPLRQARFQRS